MQLRYSIYKQNTGSPVISYWIATDHIGQHWPSPQSAHTWHVLLATNKIQAGTSQHSNVSSYMTVLLATNKIHTHQSSHYHPTDHIAQHWQSALTTCSCSTDCIFSDRPFNPENTSNRQYMTVLLATNKIQAHQSAHTWLRYSLQTK